MDHTELVFCDAHPDTGRRNRCYIWTAHSSYSNGIHCYMETGGSFDNCGRDAFNCAV